MTFFYVDVSQYDWDRQGGNPNWAAMGTTVMIARATYGDPLIFNPQTKHFADMVKGAKDAGYYLTGGYHNLIHGDDASMKRQVDLFRKELDTAGADWAMLDVEPYAALQSNGLWPRIDDVLRFRDRWNAVEPTRILTHYIARWVWEGWLGRPDMSSVVDGMLISARYAMGTKQGTPDELYGQSGGDNGLGWQPYGGVVPSVWQFTSSGLLPGKVGATDLNAFKGTREEFRARVVRSAAPVPTPAPVPALPSFKNGARELSFRSPHMVGTDVKFVQSFVGISKAGPADGDFGSKTKAGVIWYQGIRGLKKDGIVGPKTWASLLMKK